MASNESGIGPNKGSADEFTFYMRDGKQVIRRKRRRVNKQERTPKAMTVRSRWLNNINFWRDTKGCLKGLFERKRPGQSDYNCFMALNAPGEIYLRKRDADMGCSVVAPFTIADGTLQPVVEEVVREGMLVSNLYIGGLLVGEGTSVREFCVALYGPGQESLTGYELVFVGMKQGEDGDGRTLYAYPVSWRIQLSLSDNRRLMDVLGVESADWGLRNVGGYLAAQLPRNCMAAWALRRVERGKTLVTTQKLVGDNYYYRFYSSDQARYEAIYSYGKVYPKEGILDPRLSLPRGYQDLPEYFPLPQEVTDKINPPCPRWTARWPPLSARPCRRARARLPAKAYTLWDRQFSSMPSPPRATVSCAGTRAS